jgi:hypothetical protein
VAYTSAALPIAAHQKIVFNPITGSSLVDGFTGSSVVTATGAITAVSNIGSISTNFAEAYSGLTTGSQNSGLPYVRWDYQSWRTYLAIQNVSGGPVDVTVTYYDGTGANLGSANIPGIVSMAKANSNPSAAALPGGTLGIGGNAVVSATGPVIVFANNVTYPDLSNAAGNTAVPY